MIHSAVLKLTAWYVAALMFVCIVFSLVLFDINAREINSGAHTIPTFTSYLDSDIRERFAMANQRRADEAIDSLRHNLFVLNFSTLLIGAVLSYLFARFTLHPVKVAMENQARFASDASHELRTPLATMQTEIEVALRDPNAKKEDYRQLLESNLEEIDSLKKMSTALLQLTRGEKVQEQFSAVTVQDVLKETVKRHENTAANKKIQLQTNFPKDAYVVSGDYQSLVEMFSVFVDNAIKYSPKKGTIELALKQKGRHYVATVRDEGAGIQLKDQPHIFDRFYRSDESRTKGETAGFGLGLSIAKQIADLHSVQLNVKSIPGKGSTFTVIFPES